MARQTILLAALLGLLFAVATASRTTITTVEIDDSETNPRQREQSSCREQLQRESLRECQEYLKQAARRQGRYSVLALNSDDDNNDSQWLGQSGSGQDEQLRRQCCNELQRVEGQCQCEAVKEVAERARQELQRQPGQQQQREVLQRVMEKARELPGQCGLTSQRCDIRA